MAREEGRYGGRAVGGLALRVLASALVLLTALPPDRLVSQSQSITVIAAPGFRARPIRQHQFTWQVAFDSTAGGMVTRNLAIGAFTFTGSVRVEGIAPYAREPERVGYPDSARVEPDGRVVLAIGDSAAQGPILVEPRGIAGANAGRLLVRAAGWPANRVVVVTIEPLDLSVTASRAGYAERDRVRLDDVAGVAYVTDPAASPAVIAVALGRGARGRLQTGAVDQLVERDYGGAVGRERRIVSRLQLFVEPETDVNGAMSAEILFGLGRSEAEAIEAARAGNLVAPSAVPLPRVWTPAPEIMLSLMHLAGATAWAGGPVAWVSPDPTWPPGAELWRQITADARRIINREYGRPDSVALELASLRTRVIEGLFGLEADAERVIIAPRFAGVADSFTWRVDGWRFASDSLALAYRPADRRATITVGAARRVRLELRLPWLSAQSCVTMRRGQWPVERLPLVMMADGSGYVDVRSGYDPAAITVSAAACGG